MDLLRIFGLFTLTDLAGIMGGCLPWLLWLWAVDGVRPAPPTGRRLPCV
ncbi:hypothetical protein [Ottowia sp.]